MANLILSIFERVITILMFIALAVALVCKKKSKKVPLLFGHNRVSHDRIKNMYISTPQTYKAPSVVLHKWSDFH